MKRILFAVACFVCSAPLSAQSTTPSPSCVPTAIDTVRLGTAPLFRNCDVDEVARRRSAARPSFQFPQNLRCAIVELEFVVSAAGVPVEGTALVLTTNSPDFAEQVIKSLRRWRFRPAQKDGTPVAQLVHERYALADGRIPFVIAGQPAPPRQPSPPCE